MTAENMFELIGNAEDELIADAAGEQRHGRRGKWLRWGAVDACVCLLAAGALALASREQRGYTMAGGTDMIAPGGSWPEGIDPKMASVAVYPATEKLEDLADAALITRTEGEAYTMDGLSDFLPETLPEGYRFHFAHLYETRMKNGNVYHMLRVDYWTGSDDESNEGSPGIPEDSFAVFVMDYTPRTERTIYDYECEPAASDEVHYMVKTVRYPNVKNGAVFHIHCGDAYIGIDSGGLSEEEVRSLLDEITEGYCMKPLS